MSEIDTTAADATVDGAPAPFIASIPLKGDCGEVEINFDKLSIDDYKMLLIEGAKAVINSVGMSKKLPGITKLEGADREKAVAAVREQAKETINSLEANTFTGKKAKVKTSGAEATEALRLAKLLVKDHIRANGQKIGAYSAKEITEAAKAVLAGNPALLAQAKANLAARVEESKGTKGLDLNALFGAKASSDEVKAKPKVAPKRKAKVDAEGKPVLSAKQAGLVAPRQKPAGATAH